MVATINDPRRRTLGMSQFPRYDDDLFKQEQTGGDDLANSIEKILAGGGQYVQGLTEVEEGRGQRAEDVVGGALAKTSGPALSQADIDSAFGMDADRATRGYQDNIAGLRSQLGGSGVDPGSAYAAGIATNYELARVGQIADSRRSLTLEAAKLNANKKLADFNNTLSFAGIVGRDPSMVGMDWIQNVLDLRLQQRGQVRADEAARTASKDARNAGWQQGIGQIVGAGIGAL